MIDSFFKILHHPDVKKEMDFLMDYGKSKPFYTNYFGVNYNENELTSVKLYFSFFEFPDPAILNRYNFNEDFIVAMKRFWKPQPKNSMLHQGITLSLKCYLSDGNVKINSYVHYRSQDFHLGLPKNITLSEEDKNNYPGFCLETHDWGDEVKKYFYVTDAHNIGILLQKFDLQNLISPDELYQIEYTESDIESKINLITKNSESVKKCLDKDDIQNILDFSQYLYRNHQLYYYAPGYRLGKRTRAIYFLPKALFYQLTNINTIDLIL